MEFISGATLGFTKVIFGYPFDTIKSRMQTNNKLDYKFLLYNKDETVTPVFFCIYLFLIIDIQVISRAILK